MKRLQRLSNLILASCWLSRALDRARPGTVTKESFGKTAAGENIDLYTLRNAKGVEAKITNYGGIVVSLKVPDRNGKFDDVVLGFNDLESYLKERSLLRRDHRPLRQSHRQRTLHAQRRRVQARGQ